MTQALTLFDAVVLMGVGAILGLSLYTFATQRNKLSDAIIVAVISVIATAGLLAWSAVGYFKNTGEYWSAVAAVGSAISAMIAAAAVVVSAWSIRTTRRLAADEFERARQREIRDSTTLAMAFQQEIHRVLLACTHIDTIRTRANNPIDAMIDIINDRSRFLTPTIGDNIDKLGSFEREIGLEIAIALTIARSTHEMLGVKLDYITARGNELLEEWATAARAARIPLLSAYQKLSAITGRAAFSEQS